MYAPPIVWERMSYLTSCSIYVGICHLIRVYKLLYVRDQKKCNQACYFRPPLHVHYLKRKFKNIFIGDPIEEVTTGPQELNYHFSYDYDIILTDEMGHSLSTIKDENSTSPRDPAPAPGASSPVVTGVTDNVDYKREDDVFEVTRSSSELFLHAALLQTPMGM